MSKRPRSEGKKGSTCQGADYGRKGEHCSAINAKTGTNYAIWRIGLTHYPDDRKRQWTQTNTTTFWSQWQVDSLSDAQAIEAHFIKMWM